jgi:hypothetical protein
MAASAHPTIASHGGSLQCHNTLIAAFRAHETDALIDDHDSADPAGRRSSASPQLFAAKEQS